MKLPVYEQRPMNSGYQAESSRRRFVGQGFHLRSLVAESGADEFNNRMTSYPADRSIDVTPVT